MFNACEYHRLDIIRHLCRRDWTIVIQLVVSCLPNPSQSTVPDTCENLFLFWTMSPLSCKIKNIIDLIALCNYKIASLEDPLPHPCCKIASCKYMLDVFLTASTMPRLSRVSLYPSFNQSCYSWNTVEVGYLFKRIDLYGYILAPTYYSPPYGVLIRSITSFPKQIRSVVTIWWKWTSPRVQ